MVAKELTKAAGLENIFKTINKANNTQIAIFGYPLQETNIIVMTTAAI